jgi:glycosyltransferase involved in cell wall biosynthesis
MLSVIVPIFNEAENIKALHQEIETVLRSLGASHEIIFIDDGSSDNSLAILRALPRVKIISFRKNFGQTAALSAGFNLASGDIIVTLDGDGQNDPADIPALLSRLEQGYDVVCGWRRKRRDNLAKRFASWGARQLRRILVRDFIHDAGCTLRVYKAEAVDVLKNISGETHRFIPSLLAMEGFKIAELPVRHRPRRFGITKYNWRRTIKGFVDMIGIWFWRGYANRPLHLFGGLGLVLIGLGSALGAALFVLYDYSLQNKIWPLVFVVLILAGVQLFVSGLLADVATKQFYQNNNKKPYSIKDIIEN